MPIVVKIPEKVKAGGAKGHYYEKHLQNGRTVKLRNKYQHNDEATAQLPIFGKKNGELSDAERVLSFNVSYIRRPNRKG